MKSNIQLKSALLVLIFFASMSMHQFSTSAAAVQGTYEWDTVMWDTSFSTDAEYSTLETFQGRDNVLKIQNYAHYANQLTYHYDADSTVERTEISVDFYAEALGSWSWGPALRVQWDNGAYAWIRAQSSNYGQWRMTGESSVQQYGAVAHDRWYNFKIVAEHASGDRTLLSIYLRDIAYGGSEQLLIDGYVDRSIGFTITLGSLPAHDHSSRGSWETFYYDNVRVNGEELSSLNNNPIEWEASPISDSSDYDTTWQVDQSVQNPYSGIEVVESFDGHHNVLRFDKEANYHARVIKDDISINSVNEFTVFVDYYPADITAASWGPQLRLLWDGGGVAFIKDGHACTTWGISGSTKQTCSDSVDEAIEDGRWYQFRIQVTKETVKLSHADLSQHNVKNIASEIGWTQLKVPYGSGGDIWEIPRHSSMTGNFKVLLGTAKDFDYSSAWGRETYYYDNFEILTGHIDANGAGVYRLKDLNPDDDEYYPHESCVAPDAEKKWSSDYDTNDDHYKVLIEDEHSEYLGDLEISLGWIFEGHPHEYYSSDSLVVNRFEIYRPWAVSKSADWYSHQMSYQKNTGGSESVTHSFGSSIGLGSQNQAGISIMNGETISQSATWSSQGLTTHNGSIGVIYAKHTQYSITGELDHYVMGTYAGSEDVEVIFLRTISIINTKIVHTGIDIPQITGSIETRTKTEVNLGDNTLEGEFGSAQSYPFSNVMTNTRVSGFDLNIQLGVSSKDLGFISTLLQGASGFANVKYTYSNRLTVINENVYYQNFTFYNGQPGAPGVGEIIYLYDINTWGTIVSKTQLTEILP